jgi:outer membrane protein assembly factor BamB
VSAGGIVLVGTICKASGSTCGATTDAKPLICCAPPGTNGGALWALDATTGAVLNGGNPIIFTGGALRMPPTIDGDWIFVLDNSGNLYALTIDPSYPAIQTKYRAPNPHQATTWGMR